MITVKKSEYNKAKLRKLFKEASQQYIQITDEEAQELGLFEQTPTGPTGEQEPETPTGNTEPQGPTGEIEDEEFLTNDGFVKNKIEYEIISLENRTVNLKGIYYPDTYINGENINKEIDIIIPEVVIYNNVTFNIIGISNNNGFYVESRKIKSITFNKNLNIKSSDLWFCNTQNFYVDKDNQYITSIDGVLYNKELTKLIKFPPLKNIKQFIIPNSVLSIDNAFKGIRYLNEIIFNDNITELLSDCFFDSFDAIRYLKLSNKIKIIGNECLRKLKSLYKIVLPQELEKIGTLPISIEIVTIYNSNIINYKHMYANDTYIFSLLTNLKEIYVLDYNPVALDNGIFKEGQYFGNLTIYVPKGCKTIYENTEGWNKFYNIIEVEE